MEFRFESEACIESLTLYKVYRDRAGGDILRVSKGLGFSFGRVVVWLGFVLV